MKRFATFAFCAAFLFVMGFSSIATADEQAVSLDVIVIALGNAPIQNATVTVGDKEETTLNNGCCSFTLPPGSYTICAKGAWGGMSGEKCQDVVLRGEKRFVVLELFQKIESVWD
ncbi:MAG: hypothetical protein A3C38_03920 [Planctomycetes bacterium RIFCSPHIGHO2_02_FULL_50_42]|uniref:hypothetical protein n=1 Tax=Candidatus Avalokitesvara rifleensis TaxID=3367620 RepID=UPI0008C01291|nr:hypothetical protein [Candidatus Brocadiales bacterium]OHB38902.1 MAG: hypothetical protein A2060_06050 [Planctomycetes bacterium GWA2_50_13]OHB90531.1 MAG: hypothetical protein A3C38_03920 [Planctomycetes bacterium RIFCSPHIGHO2_02_FULL_50_42]OHB96043.1 MAG: hypothetical protein A3I59_10345 [Planctomycetes bacterium RIFCSPLOWO2_02_FULL_50_16]OHC05126.1 MAG: hypothetical protein A3G17_01795 [Planctomycetes bacterium RIFCSPLOWO2_12_FULL_50_35]HCN19175.1 hypothetical protein [Planctomycetia ba